MNKNIIVKSQNNVGIIQMNRPEKYNAMDTLMKSEIVQAFMDFEKDSSLKVIILIGNEKAFCTGQDLSDPNVNLSSSGELADFGEILSTQWNPLIKAIKESSKIVIACVQGACAGAGILVAWACDLIYAHPESKWTSGFSQVALIPDCGASYFWVNELGYHKAMEFALGLKNLKGEQLYKYNIVNDVSNTIVDLAMEKALIIAKLSSLTLKHLKKNFQHPTIENLNQAMKIEESSQRFLGHSKDYQEGIKAFKEKRSPQFIGQ